MLAQASRPVRAAFQAADPRLWLGWRELSASERLVSLAIVLLPVVWCLVGFEYLSVPVVAAVALYDLLRHGRIRLLSPRPEVLALLAFGCYSLINAILQAPMVTGRTVLGPTALWIASALLLWYIQSNRVRVRAPVVLGAFVVSAAQMIAFWFVIHFLLGEPRFVPPTPLLASLLFKIQPFEPGTVNPNYLQPYVPEDPVFPGMARYGFFFAYPEVCAAAVSSMILLAIDVRHRLWSVLLIAACALILVLSGTRSVWLVLPLVLAARYLIAISRVGGRALLCALIAVVGFTVFSLPPVTGSISDIYSGTVQATGNFRRDSTEVRGRIYVRTLERLPDAPIFGHGVPGRTVLPGYPYAGIGTHSFYLGNLLYQSGLVGAGLFAAFWVGLSLWLYRTRRDRPTAALLTVLLLSLVIAVMEFEMVKMLLVLLCTMLLVPSAPGRTVDEA